MASEKQEERIIEDAPFEIPPFDEKEFIRKELISFKTTVILFVFSLITAGITYALWRAELLNFFSYLLIALGLAAIALRFLFKAAKIDISHWKRKEWTGTMFLYFFFWLGFFLLMSNPPITDAAAPAVTVHVSPAWQAPGQPVEIGAYVADNADLVEDSLTFRIEGPGVTGDGPAWSKDPNDPFWTTSFVAPENGTYEVVVTASDSVGAVNRTSTSFGVGNPFTVEPPRDRRFAHSADVLLVTPRAGLDLYAVQYSLDGGATWYNFTQGTDAGTWVTKPTYAGWTTGDVQVVVQGLSQPQYFAHGDSVGPAAVRDPGGPYTITVDGTLPSVGETAPPTFKPAAWKDPKNTPGFGMLGVGLALVAGLVLVGRRHERS